MDLFQQHYLGRSWIHDNIHPSEWYKYEPLPDITFPSTDDIYLIVVFDDKKFAINKTKMNGLDMRFLQHLCSNRERYLLFDNNFTYEYINKTFKHTYDYFIDFMKIICRRDPQMIESILFNCDSVLRKYMEDHLSL